MGVYKKFSEELYQENDQAARTAVHRYLYSHGIYAVDNDDKYGPDIVVYSGLRPAYYIECEIKRVWSGPELQWDTVQLPERKTKFLDAGLPIEFWILNRECNHVIIIPESAVAKVPAIEVRNKYIEAGELFRQIPVSECIIKELV